MLLNLVAWVLILFIIVLCEIAFSFKYLDEKVVARSLLLLIALEIATPIIIYYGYKIGTIL